MGVGFRSHVGQTRLTVYKLSLHSRYKTQYCITIRRGKGWGFPGRGFEGGFCKIFKFVGTNCHRSHTHTLTHSHTHTLLHSHSPTSITRYSKICLVGSSCGPRLWSENVPRLVVVETLIIHTFTHFWDILGDVLRLCYVL